MNKKLLSILLSLCLLASLLLPVMAAENEEAEEKETRTLTISSMEAFLSFSESCVKDVYSKDLIVELKTDLDFTGLDFSPVPSFSGTFHGNKHTIKGIRLEAQGSNLGFFRYLTETALVQDLTVQGELIPQGSRKNIGGIAGTNAGTILSCKFQGQIGAAESAGGIAGSNLVTGRIEDCMVSGLVRGSHFIGGIAGENAGVIRSCKNLSSINVKEEDNKIDSVSLDPDFLMGKETVSTSTDLGGIAGTNTGVIRQCSNHGNVGYPRMGYNIGGIAGSSGGYIVSCKNSGTIQGRKEIAGIAGQMEPVVQIDFQKDTLQILREQLNTTSALANRAASNIRDSAGDLQYDVDSLHGSAEDALEALHALLPQDGELPDLDSIIAAQNSLSTSIGSMQRSLSSINGSAQSMIGTAAGDIRAINHSISQISQTLDNASETLGGTIVDISDLDTEEDLSGKVQDCHNTGNISADLNAGGIAGAVAWENDRDPEEDYTVAGETSLNFDSRLRAVILDCSNTAKIQVSKMSGGGIAGSLSLGLVKNSMNTGMVEGENADYLGGIAGSSLGFLRNNHVKCRLLGHSYLGGIAGSASIASGCRSTALIEGGGEQLGSVLGLAEEDRTESENPISLNYYLPYAEHLGAIDGIDYYAQADSLSKEDFMALPELPAMFFSSSMTFCYPDGSTQKISVPLESSVSQDQIPQPPRKEGYIGKWEGLSDLDLNHMFFNVVLNAEFIPINQVVESLEKTPGGLPVLLAEGSFGEQETVSISPAQELPRKDSVTEAWLLPDFGENSQVQIHLAIPEGMDQKAARAMVQSADGSWEEREASLDGSYLVFSADNSDLAVSIYASQDQEIRNLVILIASAAALILLITVLLILKKHKKKKAKKASK